MFKLGFLTTSFYTPLFIYISNSEVITSGGTFCTLLTSGLEISVSDAAIKGSKLWSATCFDLNDNSSDALGYFGVGDKESLFQGH